MNEGLLTTWREFLYPLGFIASLFFGARFLVQWLQSEKVKKSVAPPLFWKFSSYGNLSLMIHSLIQLQLPIAFIQASLWVIARRNLNLMQPHPAPIKWVLTRFVMIFSFVACSFLVQTFVFSDWAWMSIPKHPWSPLEISGAWHWIGLLGLLLFASRFWVQWVQAERAQKSLLGASFWYLSIVGASLSCLYFFHIKDIANLIPALLGWVPYIRNLMIIYAKPRAKESSCQPPL